MTNQPTISLVISAYNEEKYLGVCLDAVMKVSDKFLEIIVVDNASTDGTRALAEQYASVRVVREEVRGPNAARRCGSEIARGEIIAFIDADTRMPTDWPKIVYAEFSTNPKLVCLSGPYIYYDFKTWWQKLLVGVYWYVLTMPLYFILGYMVIAGNFAIRREILEKMGGLDPAIKFYGDDTDTARRAHQFGQVKFKLELAMPTSGRRLTRQGWLNTAWFYIINFLSEVFARKPVTKDHIDFR